MNTEAFFNEYEQLAKQNHVLTIGLERRYPHNMLQKTFNWEYSTPIEVGFKDCRIVKHSWTNLLQDLVVTLTQMYPSDPFELYQFKTDWSKADVFRPEPFINCKKINKNLYLNVNFTALHAIWFIQDIFSYYKIKPEESFLVVHQAPKGE